uniref:Candidate secreted effector n=1 Tax=Meloidogyne incognita TaxID=6306 RepID=A0A914LEZ2_MELIC
MLSAAFKKGFRLCRRLITSIKCWCWIAFHIKSVNICMKYLPTICSRKSVERTYPKMSGLFFEGKRSNDSPKIETSRRQLIC